jgi:hypothetical protein
MASIQQTLSFANVPTKDFAEALLTEPSIKLTGSALQPEAHAWLFYSLNHIVGLMIRDGVTNEEVSKLYEDAAKTIAVPAVAYVLAICAGEMRHAKNKDLSKIPLDFDELAAWTFVVSRIIGKSSARVAPFTTGDWAGKGFSILSLVKVFEYGFDNLKWSSAYGGKKWGVIARTLRQWLDGTISIEVFLDTVWTLQHNTAAIFNKSIIYQNSTHRLQKILDVQAAGQLPNWNPTYSFEDQLTDLLVYTYKNEVLPWAKEQWPELQEPANMTKIAAGSKASSMWQKEIAKDPNQLVLKPGAAPVVVEKVEKERKEDG